MARRRPTERDSQAACRVLVNQTGAIVHQELFERATDPAPLLVLTGTPHPPSRPGVTTVQAPRYVAGGFLRGALAWLRFATAAAWKLLRIDRDALVVATTNPPVMPHALWLLHRVRGLRYGLLVWDLYPATLVQAGHVGRDSLLARTWRALNARACREAEVVLCIGARMADGVREEVRAQGMDCRIEVVPNCVDTAWIRPRAKDSNPFAREHGQVDRFTVLYSGNFGGTHGLEMLPGVAAALADDERFRFLLIGEGRGRAALEAAAARLRVRNLTVLPHQPWDVLPLSLACGDVAVVAQAPGTERNSFPSKVYSSLGAGSAILAITSTDSDLAELVRGHDCGVVVAWGDVAGAAAALRSLADDPQRLGRLRANARAAAEQHYDVATVARRLRAALSRPPPAP